MADHFTRGPSALPCPAAVHCTLCIGQLTGGSDLVEKQSEENEGGVCANTALSDSPMRSHSNRFGTPPSELLNRRPKGASINDIRKIFRFFDPLPLCPHLDLHSLFHDPLPPPKRTSYLNYPYGKESTKRRRLKWPQQQFRIGAGQSPQNQKWDKFREREGGTGHLVRGCVTFPRAIPKLCQFLSAQLRSGPSLQKHFLFTLQMFVGPPGSF